MFSTTKHRSDAMDNFDCQNGSLDINQHVLEEDRINNESLSSLGEPWFVGKDVAEALGYGRADNAIRQHVEKEDKLTHQISASGQNRNMYVINESGLYALIFGSKLESAKRFKHWVTSEVLPKWTPLPHTHCAKLHSENTNSRRRNYLLTTVTTQELNF